MVISINRTAGVVSAVSIPRDLYVYLPGFNMQKINTAYFYGEENKVEGGGFKMLLDAVHYNLGLNIDYYVRVNFTGFGDIIDALGGIDITVDCVIRDWKLKSPELDKQVADNYEKFTLPIGLQHIGQGIANTVTRERAFAGQHLEQHASERPDVAALVGWLALRLLRTHVGGRTK